MIYEGIHFDISEKEYRESPGVSQSELKEFENSAAHFHSVITAEKKEQSEAQLIGSLTHSLILCNKQDFVSIPNDAPTKPTKAVMNAKKPSPESVEAIAWWKKFTDENAGKEIVTKKIADNLFGMRDSVWSHPDARAILDRPGNNEVACWKQDATTGILMRGRADRVCMDDDQLMTIPDLKTVQRGCAGEYEFAKSIIGWGYDVQAAVYLDLFGATFFVFIVVEKEPPFAVNVYNLEQPSIQLGRKKYRKYLATLKECLATNVWPAYPTGIKPINVPEWALNRPN